MEPVLGSLPELAWLPVDGLSVDPTYQRTLDTQRSQKLIARIAERFSWAAFGTVTACPVGENCWRLIDGQHRVEAARRREVSHVPAIVLRLSQRDQAEAFIRANDRVPISANALFYARARSGNDPEAETILRACDAARIKVTKYAIGNMHAPVNSTSAVSALYAVLRRDGEAGLRRSLSLLSSAFRDQRGGLAPYLITGTATFAKTRPDREVTDCLAGIGLSRLTIIAGMGRGATGRADAVLRALVSESHRLSVLPPSRMGITRERLMAGR